MNMDKAYSKIVRYCKSNNITIVRGNSWYAFLDENKITEVWRGKPSKTWVYTMLHELGHLKLHKRRNYAQKNWKSIESFNQDSPDLILASQIIREEVEAWEEGYRISTMLDIDIDRIDYDKYSAPFLMEYMKHLSEGYKKKLKKRK
jgi:hypothetical protein